MRLLVVSAQQDIRAQQEITDTLDLVHLATHKYNNTFHSVLKVKPNEVLHDTSGKPLEDVKNRLIPTQDNVRNNSNTFSRTYKEGDIVFVRKNLRLRNKFDKVFLEKNNPKKTTPITTGSISC